MENQKNEFAMSDLTAGQLNAIVKKLGGYEGAMKFLRDELEVSPPVAENTGIHRVYPPNYPPFA